YRRHDHQQDRVGRQRQLCLWPGRHFSALWRRICHLRLGPEANEQWEGMGLDQVQLSKTVMELGYLGFFLFLLIIYKIYKMNVSFYKNIQDDYWKSISVGFSGIIFLYVIGIIYNSVWVINSISFIFWFLSASLFIVAKRSFSK
ncbi:hypothetical protein LCGC14_2533690, partial [marine sediment metagenome]